jgi:hypothetical protein
MKASEETDNWHKAGVEKGACFEALFYCTRAKVIVAQFSHGFRKSLYWRRLHENRCRRLSPRSTRLSYNCPVFPSSRACLFTNVMRSVGAGQFWECVAEINLVTGKLKPVISKDDLARLKPPSPYSKIDWVSGLMSISPNGRLLYYVIGMQREVSKGSIASAEDYWLCEYNLAQKKIRRLSLLQHTFF